MNSERIFIFIVGLVFTIGWTVLFWSLKNLRNDIKELFKLTNKQELEIQKSKDSIRHNENKLWSDDKLIGVINKAIDSKFLAWENRLLRKGVIPSNNKE